MPRLLLALDIATCTGWAMGDPMTHRVATGPLLDGGDWPKPTSGFRSSAGTDLGTRLLAFERDWGAVLGGQRPAWVALEAPIMGSNAANMDTVRLLNGYIGILHMLCRRFGMPAPIEAENSTIKKHFAGTGRAKKPDMVEACRRRGWSVTDHNEADALALFDLMSARIQHGEHPR